MGSLELTFPMDSPDKDYVDMSASKEKINLSRKTNVSSREDVVASREEEYCLWEPKEATSLPKSAPNKSIKNLPKSEVKESAEYCLWEPDETVSRRGSSSSRRGSRKDSSQTPSSNSSISKGEFKENSEPDSETGCIRISQESFRLWPDTKFGFRRRACTVAAAESYPRQRDKLHYNLSSSPRDKLAVSSPAAASKSIGNGTDYLSPGGINIRRRHNEEYCEYDLSSSAPSAPDSSATLIQHPAQQPTNLRRYTVSKTYFPTRSSSSFSFRGSGKIPSTTNIKSSISFSERLTSTTTTKPLNSSSMGEISGGASSETMSVQAVTNKETGNQTLSRIKKSIGKFVGRSRTRASDQDPVLPAPDPHKEVETSWKECPFVIQTVADSKQKGLPIIPMPLYPVTNIPKMDPKSEQPKSGDSKSSPRFEKSGNEYRNKYSESERTSTRNLSECSTYSTYSFPASDSSCSLMPDCLCVRCTSNTTSVENSLYILLDQTPSDEGEAFSFERTKSDASSLNTSRPSILKTSPEKKYFPNRRETVSESSGGKQQYGLGQSHLQPASSNDLQLVNDTFLHTRQNSEPSQPINYLVMDKRITAIDPILQHTLTMNNNLSGYMVMEPGKGIQIIPTSGNINIPQDQYLVMDLSNKAIITTDNNNDYMLMTNQLSAANSNYLSMSQPESVSHLTSASHQTYTMSSNSQPSLTVPSLESIIQPLRSVHSSISQPSLANHSSRKNSLVGGEVNGPTSLSQPFLNSDNIILNIKGKGETLDEYMTMDPVSSYMTMGSNTNQTQNNPTINKSTTNVNNEYILMYSPEGEQIQNKTNNLSVPLELPNFPTVKDSMVMDTPNSIDIATNSTTTTTKSSSSYARSFNALKLSFNKQLIMSKSSNSSSKSQKVPASPTPSKSSTSISSSVSSPTSEPSSLTYQRLSPPVTSSSGHRNSFSQKLSPITRRLPSIKLKSNNNQDRNVQEKPALTTPTVEVDPNGCYLIVDGHGQVLQDVTVLQEVLKDPRIAGAYSSVNCSSVKRKVSFSTRLPGISQDQNTPSNNEAKPNYMSCGPGSSSGTGTANQLRSKSMTEDEVEVLKGKLTYYMNVTQENIEYRRHKKANKNKEDYVMVNYPNPPASKPQNIKTKSEKLFLSLSN